MSQVTKQTRVVQIDPERMNSELASAHPSEIIRWAAGVFGSDLLMTSSFGADSLCAIHLAISVMPDVRILFVNTGYLFPETLAFMEEVKQRYNLNVLEYKTRNDPIVWLTVNGEPDPRVRRNVDACCAANKNEVFDRAIRELKPAAWMRGVRSDQSDHRKNMQIVQWNNRANCWAVSPLLNWDTRQVYQYMKQHELPHHPLWAKGYISIGCSPETCTRPVGEGEDLRSGRWAGMEKTECGIHLDHGAGI
ncbi:MAG TPA: phosphoadenylyl-sulfate reductase [Phycisphaerae bacterium]|nr:phosphoadenylyl-sulfate reductase [Phycisphaerae bacterium]